MKVRVTPLVDEGARRRLDMLGMRQEEPESQLQCCSG
jgi:hypothetical protein